ncbi:Fe-S cluster assembly protein SufD [Dokdonella sp.]|uniref:Fe-S cluster assembly protein SufD n=1 Tax=Dokdonella sp. TaxID=2291710 RepID=UPI003C66D88C
MTAGFLEPLLADGAAAAGGQSAWLADVREHAIQQLARDGMPGPRSEAWKYSSLRALAQRRYQRGDDDAKARAIAPTLLDLPGIDGPRLVFVNGAFREDLSNIPAIDGLRMQALSSLLESEPDSLQPYLARSYDDGSDVFARLNTALAFDGPVIRVAAGKRIDPVVHLVMVGAEATSELAWQLRGIVEIGERAKLTLIEHHIGEDGQRHFGNQLTQISIAAHARLDMLQIQHSAESSSLVRRTEADLGVEGHFELRSIEAGAQWMRHDLVVRLEGDRSRFTSRGVFALRNRQHSDTRLDVRHIARDTACDIVWRGVADQRSRGVFHGAITVESGADGSDAQLSNKNLLLSEQAEIDTQPVLEIHADEVKAAHGATVGQLDESALFYLRTRGLSVDEARSMLTLAFCRVAFDSIENEVLREHIDTLLLDRLPIMSDGSTDAGSIE